MDKDKNVQNRFSQKSFGKKRLKLFCSCKALKLSFNIKSNCHDKCSKKVDP